METSGHLQHLAVINDIINHLSEPTETNNSGEVQSVLASKNVPTQTHSCPHHQQRMQSGNIHITSIHVQLSTSSHVNEVNIR